MITLAAPIYISAAAIAAGIGIKTFNTKTQIRPIAEFEPVESVIISEDYFQGGYDASGLARAILQAGATLVIASSNERSQTVKQLVDLNLDHDQRNRVKIRTLAHGNLWLRDYGPVFAHSLRGLELVDFQWGGKPQESEDFPVTLGHYLHKPVRRMLANLDGGNFLSDGATCVTSRDRAATLEPTPETFQAIGCAKLVILENPPHPHVDMWLKITGPGKALVAELDTSARSALRRYYGGRIPDDHQKMGERLDAMAHALAPYFTIQRIPMPIAYRGTFRSFTNAILVNGTAIVPRYKTYGWGYDQYPDATEERDYEKTVEDRFAEHGFSVTFVDADGLIFNGGAFHCIALQIPE